MDLKIDSLGFDFEIQVIRHCSLNDLPMFIYIASLLHREYGQDSTMSLELCFLLPSMEVHSGNDIVASG